MLQKDGLSAKAGASLQTSLVYGITGGGILGMIEILIAWPIYYWKLPGLAQIMEGPLIYMAIGVGWGIICHILRFILNSLRVHDSLPAEADCLCGAANITLAIAVWVAVWSGRIFLDNAEKAVTIPHKVGLACMSCILAWLLYNFLKRQKDKGWLFTSYSALSLVLYSVAAISLCLNTMAFDDFIPPWMADTESDIKAVSFLPATARNRPNIILITPDTLRSDHLSCYGYTGIKTPAIDSLAADGVLFRKAVSAAPWTLPSFASLLTSLYPTVHGAGRNQNMENTGIADQAVSLPQILKKAGYYTKAIVDNPFLDTIYGFNRGFDDYKDKSFRIDKSKQEKVEKRAAPLLWTNTWKTILKSEILRCSNLATTDEAIQWLEQNPYSPFFFWIHYFGLHLPYEQCGSYNPDPAYRGRLFQISQEDLRKLRNKVSAGNYLLDLADKNHLRSMYDGELLSIDDGVGRILDKLRQLNLMDNTLVIFTSDHGEEFWEHNGFEHGHSLYRELLQVPLIIKWPGVLPAGKVVDDQVRTMDVMPTVMELLDVKYSGDLAGHSLLPLIKGEGRGDRVAFNENLLYYEEQKAVNTGKYKLIYTPDLENLELYDVEADPGEKRNIAAEMPAETLQLKEQLLGWIKDCQTKAVALHKGKAPVPVKDEDMVRQLKSLGYF